jgi:hypothetical protein
MSKRKGGSVSVIDSLFCSAIPASKIPKTGTKTETKTRSVKEKHGKETCKLKLTSILQCNQLKSNTNKHCLTLKGEKVDNAFVHANDVIINSQTDVCVTGELDTFKTLIDNIFVSSMKEGCVKIDLDLQCSPPMPPPKSKKNETYCDFEYEYNKNTKNIDKIDNICTNKQDDLLELFRNFINNVLKELLELFYKDIVKNTLTIDFQIVFEGVLISFIVDAIFLQCNTLNQEESFLFDIFCKHFKTFVKIKISMKSKNPEIPLSKITQVFIIGKTRELCKIPTINTIIKTLIINQFKYSTSLC